MSRNNLYKIGDDIYFESNFSTPYRIGRIEELKKTPAGNIEAKVRCYYRRRDLPNSLLITADKYLNAFGNEINTVSENQKLIKLKELYLSRKIDVISVKQIKGKCTVTLLNEVESYYSYLNKEDTFFYGLVYDPYFRTLQPDKGEIRVGNRYQADIPELLKDIKIEDRNLETLIWTPEHNLTDNKINQFLMTSRSIGTFARALNSINSINQPNLYKNASAASRDISVFHAMDILHKNQYSISDAISALISQTDSIICRDEIEDWSNFEANLFEEALETCGKKFHDIREYFLPWKSIKNIIEFYYMWKTTERYIQHKRIKQIKEESKLNEINIPILIEKNNEKVACSKPCESCDVSTSKQWISWHTKKMQKNLCEQCWNYWKKYGGFKNLSIIFNPENDYFQMDVNENTKEESVPIMHITRRKYRCNTFGCGKKFKVKNQLFNHYCISHGLPMKHRPIKDKKRSFYLATTVFTKLLRRYCKTLLTPRHAARSPFIYINTQAIKMNQQNIAGKMIELFKKFLKNKKKNRLSITAIASKLALLHNLELTIPYWLQKINKNKSETIAFQKSSNIKSNNSSYDTITPKNLSKQLPTHAEVQELSGYFNKNYTNGTHNIVPDDMYFKSNLFYKNRRQLIPINQLKSVARKPWLYELSQFNIFV